MESSGIINSISFPSLYASALLPSWINWYNLGMASCLAQLSSSDDCFNPPILKNIKLIIRKRPMTEAAITIVFFTFHWNPSGSNFAATSDSIVSGSPCDIIQYTSTFCSTPFSLGLPRYFVSNSDSLIIASWTLLVIAIPPGAENGSIRAATLTSSPMISFSSIKISPWCIPILRSRSSICLDASCSLIQQLTASVTVSKIRRRPSPISLTHMPL